MAKSGKTSFRLSLLSLVAIMVVGLPTIGLLSKVPWASLGERLAKPENISAISLSLWSSTLASFISLLLGVPLAWTLARSNLRLTTLLRPLVLAPIVLPPTVAGLALLSLLGRKGTIGSWLDSTFNYTIAFTPVAVLVTGVFVSMPFLILVVEATFRQLPHDIEDQARVDGASEFLIFMKVALPQARNGILTGALLAWARALGEFGATMMFAGSVPGRTLTWPMAVYTGLETNLADAYALSGVMVIIAISVVFLLRNRLTQVFARS